MAQCPVCNAKIPDDFGLIECPSCSAQLIVHMDGRVEYSGANESPSEVSEDEVTPTVLRPQPPEEDFNFGEASPEIEIPADTPNLESPGNSQLGEDFVLSPEELVPTVAAQPLEEPFPVVQDNAPTEVYRPEGPAVDSPDLSDIAEFGNSDQASGRDGSLRYNLFITGIDTADVREAFREAITDRKLVWDIDQILRSLRNGEVEIQNVTPPKAYILISRLRGIPVRVRWEQYALSQT